MIDTITIIRGYHYDGKAYLTKDAAESAARKNGHLVIDWFWEAELGVYGCDYEHLAAL
jgi:fructose-specific component phosphotransferase system IIB-like protein